jgi:hypothetical protein
MAQPLERGQAHNFTKSCPAFATEYAVVMLRENRNQESDKICP